MGPRLKRTEPPAALQSIKPLFRLQDPPSSAPNSLPSTHGIESQIDPLVSPTTVSVGPHFGHCSGGRGRGPRKAFSPRGSIFTESGAPSPVNLKLVCTSDARDDFPLTSQPLERHLLNTNLYLRLVPK